MKKFTILCFSLLVISFQSCSEIADDAAQSGESFTNADIEHTWKHNASGLVIRISGGNATVVAVGTAMPSGAKGGICLKEIEHLQGGYWDAYNYTYYTNGTWGQTSVVGIAMTDDKKEFRIGTAVYTKQ
jgi:hypothetical protein